MRVNGVVKFYRAEKQFGFIKCDDGQPDAFVHASALKDAGIDDLADGDRVSFELIDGKKGKGKKAVELRVED